MKPVLRAPHPIFSVRKRVRRFRARRIAIPLMLATVCAYGQSWRESYYPHHNFTFAMGAAQPRADLANAFGVRPLISAAYGWRFNRYLQADVGLDTVFGAAGVRAFEDTGIGYARIRDYEFFLPMGGRVILPLFRGRLLIAGGGGGAWAHYTELLHQPADYFHIDCLTCGSRNGWMSYALADISAFLDQGQHFRVGAVTKVYRGYTDGDPLGSLPVGRTTDRWVNIMGLFGFSF
jgi:hypothetical protein